jgi:hypothetical protein
MEKRMKQTAAMAAVTALASIGTARAHHSISMFDISKAVWLKGTVVRYEPIAPHAMIAVEVAGDDGEAQQWVIEGPNPARLNRVLRLNGLSAAGAFLKPGATIEVCGFALRERWNPERMYPNTVWSSSRFIHGQVLVMPDGRMQSWGPYGKIENCVRPNDRTRPWIDFLNADPLARDSWCNGLSDYDSQFATAPSEAFVDDISNRIDNPCK